MVRPVLALLPSPFLGPASWEPVAGMLRDAGHDVIVTGHADRAPATPAEVLAELSSSLPQRPTVLVPHSNAGLYVPALAARLPVVGSVHVDAVLVPADRDDAPAGPPAMVESLVPLAVDGVLPPWPRWFAPGAVEALLPPGAAAEVLGQARALPLSYLRSRVPCPRGRTVPGAYLAFGDTYADELADARGRGWPCEVLQGGHLHQVADPEVVGAALLRLLDGVLGRADH